MMNQEMLSFPIIRKQDKSILFDKYGATLRNFYSDLEYKPHCISYTAIDTELPF